MKKFINDVANVETEMLDGMAATYPQYVKRMDGLDVIVRADKKADKVALVSGGGSGHEPTHAGSVHDQSRDQCMISHVNSACSVT